MAATCVKEGQVSSQKNSLSEYFNGLNPEYQSRYLAKIELCGNVDPYCMKKAEFSYEFTDLPNLQFPDISNYLVVQTSFYSKNQMKAYTIALPKCIMDYRSEESLKLSDEMLLQCCNKLSITLTESQVKNVEEETRRQSNLRIWFAQRAGRITASNLKAVLSTDPEKPSKSLIKVICYPEAHRFSNCATSYGCKHESQARKTYEQIMSKEHENFSIYDSGLRINLKWPHMGASPDGVVNCDCCGNGACEIKCPYCYQDKENLASCAGEKGFCLTKANNGEVQLDRSHKYYYQVQAQIHIMEADYCDFIIWNKNDIFVERILPDYELWNRILPKVDIFFRSCILREVLGKQFTKQMVSTLKQTENRSD